MRSTCPKTSSEAAAVHAAAKADALTGSPVTPQGRALLASRRNWPGLEGAWCAECCCGSTLLIGYVDLDVDDATA